MKLMTSLLTLALAAAIAMSAETTSKPKKEPGAPASKKSMSAGRIDRMAKVLNLTDDQVKQLTEIAQANDKALADFDTANAAKLKTFEAANEAAKTAKDKQAQKAAAADLKALRDERAALAAKGDEQLMAVLTGEQKAKWYELLVMDAAVGKLEKLGLTDQQKAQIRETYQKLAMGADLSTDAARTKLSQALHQEVVKNILTPEQQKQLQDKATSKPVKAE